MSFWILVTVLLAGTILYVAASARRARLRVDSTTPEAVYEQRADELAQDLAAGQLDATQTAAVSAELARQALREVPPAPSLKSPQGRRGAFVALSALLPAIAIPLYLMLGTPEVLNPAATKATEHLSMQQMIEQLQQRIDAQPDDAEARLWMARVRMATEQYEQAVEQYAKVLALVGENPDVLVQYADALAMQNGGRMAGKPLELVERALQADPNHLSALWLAGLAAQEANDLPKARELLTRARAAAEAAHRPTAELDAQIAALDGEQAAPATPPAAPGGDGPRIEVAVAVAPALAAQIGEGAVLFVLAKQPAGMPMPLAVQRLPAQGFPLNVTLDDSLAMSPQAKLSSATEVEVIARISRSGQASAASGDLEGRTGPITVGGTQQVSVTIDRVVP
ncbi:MAG TPA: c-type cytochrome biogenesis protein CcmI [Gammaproteobacteria bacterium]|nr:c-type cytochrome biogenesis protein CcmI [Gammaproteobacteria bacterium]